MSLAQNDPLTIVFSSLQSVSLQFLVMWLLIAALMYVILKYGFKVAEITWKPLFIAVGMALIIMVIRAVLNLAATLALPAGLLSIRHVNRLRLYTIRHNRLSPSQAITILSTQSLAVFNSLEATTATFNAISVFLFGAAFVWLGILCTMACRSNQTRPINAQTNPCFSSRNTSHLAGADFPAARLRLTRQNTLFNPTFLLF